ncbi:hypothetical protein ROZALSC1DRAFT_24029, partial [Rozella allomycis CSF55]
MHHAKNFYKIFDAFMPIRVSRRAPVKENMMKRRSPSCPNYFSGIFVILECVRRSYKVPGIIDIFKIQYYRGKTVPEFIGRFQDLLAENNIATIPDPQHSLIKELLFSKLPDSVKRVLNNKP